MSVIELNSAGCFPGRLIVELAVPTWWTSAGKLNRFDIAKVALSVEIRYSRHVCLNVPACSAADNLSPEKYLSLPTLQGSSLTRRVVAPIRRDVKALCCVPYTCCLLERRLFLGGK